MAHSDRVGVGECKAEFTRMAGMFFANAVEFATQVLQWGLHLWQNVTLEICLELLAAYFHTPPAFAECQQTS